VPIVTQALPTPKTQLKNKLKIFEFQLKMWQIQLMKKIDCISGGCASSYTLYQV
jgi:hypothetical protein